MNSKSAEVLPRIFVVGTGRSGTWLLYKVLGAHKDVHTFPAELRFLIDPGGLLDLLDALTVQYSPNNARVSLNRFNKLMRVHLATPGRSPYSSIDLPSWLGGDYYWKRLDDLFRQITRLEYLGFAWDREVPVQSRIVAWAVRLHEFKEKLRGRSPVFNIDVGLFAKSNIMVGKYFANRASLVELAARFVDDLLLNAALERKKTTWCEKTPQHLLHLDFIWELFPESVCLHIVRDPRGVAYSMMKQRWGPNDLRGSCLLLKDTYERWLQLKNKLDIENRRYLELKLETLAANPTDVVEKVAAYCGLADGFRDLPDFSIERVISWRQDMNTKEQQLVDSLLGPYILQMGYEI